MRYFDAVCRKSGVANCKVDGSMKKRRVDVLVIGGGATGCGILRDLTLRGLRCALVEKNDLASGTTGRNHGLLHSGARYAVNDAHSAKECIRENKILRDIAFHCIEDTEGLFVTLQEDDTAYADRLVSGCSEAGIACKEISPAQAFHREPNLNRKVNRAILVPDGTIDPFRLVSANVLDASERGAQVFTHTKVTQILREGTRVVGVHCVTRNNNALEINCKILINAAGVWGGHICNLADIPLRMFPSKGSMLIIDYRVNNLVVNRCRPPANGDIVVPGDTVSLIGTTSKKIDYNKIEELVVDDDEIDVLLRDGEQLIPNVSRTRALRAYCGVRPLVDVGGTEQGRDISRGIVLLDHEQRDGLTGFISITGGKLMTYRQMAQQAADLACLKLGVSKTCQTHKRPLPGSEKKTPGKKKIKLFTGIPASVVGSTHYRHGERIRNILRKDARNYRLICECEMVTEGEVAYALSHLNARDLIDLRRRTRVGMGPCQGELCAYRCAGLLHEIDGVSANEALVHLKHFLEERFRGIKPVMWGDGLREAEFTYWIYEGLLGLGSIDCDDQGT